MSRRLGADHLAGALMAGVINTEMRWEGKRQVAPGLTHWHEALTELLDEARRDGVPEYAEVSYVSTIRLWRGNAEVLGVTLTLKWKPEA